MFVGGTARISVRLCPTYRKYQYTFLPIQCALDVDTVILKFHNAVRLCPRFDNTSCVGLDQTCELYHP